MSDTLSNAPNIEPDSGREMNRLLLGITLGSMFLVTAVFLFAPTVDPYRSRPATFDIHTESSGLLVTNMTDRFRNNCVITINTVTGRYNRIESFSPKGWAVLAYDSFERVDGLRLDPDQGLLRALAARFDIHCAGRATSESWSGQRFCFVTVVRRPTEQRTLR